MMDDVCDDEFVVSVCQLHVDKTTLFQPLCDFGR